MLRTARVIIAAVIVVLTFLLSVQPASAHGADGASSSNYRTTVTSVTPAQPEIAIQVKEHGDRMQLKNGSSKEVIILGYQNEPYIKVVESGVYENRLSPAVYKNADRYGTTELPAFANAQAAPEWRKVSSGNIAVWHDHRAHWMSTTAPPVVEGNRSVSHMLIPGWTIPLTVDAAAVTIAGDVQWVPPQSKWTGLGVAFIAALVIAGLARLRSMSFAIGVGVAVLIVVDMVHVSGLFIGGAGQLLTRLGAALTTDAASLMAWGIGIWVIIAVRKQQYEVVGYAGLFVAAVILLFGGLTDLSTMWNSQVAFAWPGWMSRLAVAVTIGCGIATVVTSALLIYGSVARARLAEVGNDNNGAPSHH